MMSTPLYISDLDGTLLCPDARLSEFSRDGLNRLIANGLHFTVATARSVVSISQLLPDLRLELPVINLNGALVSDLESGRHLAVQALPTEVAAQVLARIEEVGLQPFVSTCGEERDALYYTSVQNPGMQWYLDDRQRAGDRRLTLTNDLHRAMNDSVLCFTVIAQQPALLSELHTDLDSSYPGLLQMYTFANSYSNVDDTWLTISDARATKAQGIRLLLDMGDYRTDELTVFGDSDNDLEMFRIAPRAIATANATPQILALATETIGPNSEDSVVRYLQTRH